MDLYVKRMQKIFGKTPISFSSQSQILADKKAKQILIGIGLAVAVGTGIYIGYQVRKKWWSGDRPGKDQPNTNETKLPVKEEPKSEVYSNFSGIRKLSRKEKREQMKKEYFKNRMKVV